MEEGLPPPREDYPCWGEVGERIKAKAGKKLEAGVSPVGGRTGRANGADEDWTIDGDTDAGSTATTSGGGGSKDRAWLLAARWRSGLFLRAVFFPGTPERERDGYLSAMNEMRRDEVEGVFGVICVEVSNGARGWRCLVELNGGGRNVGRLELGCKDDGSGDILNLHRQSPGKVRVKVRHLGISSGGKLVDPLFAGIARDPSSANFPNVHLQSRRNEGLANTG